MVTLEQVQSFKADNAALVDLAYEDLAAIWAALDLTDPFAVKAVLLEAFPDLVATYGVAAGTVAADFYDELRDEAQAAGRFTAIAAATPDPEALAANARWALGGLFKGDPAASLSAFSGALDKGIKRAARDTIAGSAERDPAKARWARVPSGRGCAFCLMLASRGAVYGSKSAAGGMRDYHDHCHCQPVPVWRPRDLPYDPSKLYDQYLDVHEPGMTAKQTTAAMRAEYGLK